eukprot:1157419-Pelagomonas_calceolata.AAC.12
MLHLLPARYPPVPRFKPFTWYTAVRNADPEMVGVHTCVQPPSEKGSRTVHESFSPLIPPQLAKIMAADPYFVTQDNGAGAPVHFATTYRQLDMVHHLLNNGAEVNQRDPRGLTPLHRAAHLAHLDGYLEIYEYLLSRGADPSIQANELEPYLAPGRRPVPSDMACDAEVGNALKLIEARYQAIPKVCVSWSMIMERHDACSCPCVGSVFDQGWCSMIVRSACAGPCAACRYRRLVGSVRLWAGGHQNLGPGLRATVP